MPEKIFKNSQRGVSLVETLIALSIFSLVGVAFISGLGTSLNGVIVNQGQVTAESLAKSQMEYVKRQEYRVDLQYARLEADEIPSGYDIEITAERMDPRGDGTDNDDALQKIIITISRNVKTIFTLEGYKSFGG